MKLFYDGEPFETSPIGSRYEPLRVYLIAEDKGYSNWRTQASTLLFVTGCFMGGLKQFRAAIEASYPAGHQHRIEYAAAIEAAQEHYRQMAHEPAKVPSAEWIAEAG